MNIVIVGESLFSLALAKKFKKREHELFLMIRDKEKALQISAESEITVINRDPAQVGDLDKLGLEQCDVFIASTEEDELNILSALYARTKGVGKIFVKLKNPYLEPMLRSMGLHPINPQEYAAEGVALDVLKPLVSDLVGIEKGEFNLVERPIEYYKNLVGKRLGSMQGEFFNVIAVYKDGVFKFSADSKIEEESMLIILYQTGKLKEVEKILKKI